MLSDELHALGVGRDKLFDILRANQLLVAPKRTYHLTTHSHHRFRKHKNLIADTVPSRPEEQWVSDITYIGKRDNPFYLALITDAYSKKIVGYNVSDRLDVRGSLEALKQALKGRESKRAWNLIHHSDRGIQYCSAPYQNLLTKHRIRCSMTESADPYANAVAERVNGILKQEFMIDKYGATLEQKKALVQDAIRKYNALRPHSSNGYLTPNQMHRQQDRPIKKYQNIQLVKRASPTG